MTVNDHPKVGDLRPSQIMFSFGVGAIVDLPYISVIVMGLDDWPSDPGLVHEISEDRLLYSVREQLGQQVQRLQSPPVVPESEGPPNPFERQQHVGVPVAPFPRWMVCPRCQSLAPLGTGLFELRSDPFHPDRTQYVHVNCRKSVMPPAVVPARFLVACENGHLDDFPWIEFAHRGPTTCPSLLRLIEHGPSGEARDLEVHCDSCKDGHRRLSDAFGVSGRFTLPFCRGRRPHLRDYDEKECGLQVRAILLGASNLWFADVLTTLAIPASSNRVAQIVTDKWAILRNLQTLQNVTLLRQIGQLGDLSIYGDDEIWHAIQMRRQQEQSPMSAEPTDLKQPEWKLLTHPDALPATDDFRLRSVSVPGSLKDFVTGVVLVERMREVRALVGFTRIDAPGELGDDEAVVATRRMRISRQDPPWVPASEVRGEGIFIQFREDRIQEWSVQPAVKEWEKEFFASHSSWRRTHFIEPVEGKFPGLRFVLLHSFAHALMRQLALECGYTGASVRERIYSRNTDDPETPGDPMAGVLIYTSAPDSEGTLGGLVSLGEPAELMRHVSAALRNAGVCASDPLCAENMPGQRGATLHAAACHACMFVPETSCERGNKYLDRSVLVATVEHDNLAFFRGRL